MSKAKEKPTFERVRDMVSEHLGLVEGQVHLQSNLVDHLGADSLDVMELIMQSEDEFDLDIEERDINKCRTVQDLVDLIERLRKK